MEQNKIEKGESHLLWQTPHSSGLDDSCPWHIMWRVSRSSSENDL